MPDWWAEDFEPTLKADRLGRGHVWIASCQCPVCLFCMRPACGLISETERCQGILGKALAKYQIQIAGQEPAPKEE